MNSLSKNNEWGKDDEMLEDVLAPSDWRLKAILEYRTEMNKQERKKEKQAVIKARRCLVKNNINNPYAQAIVLHKLGAARAVILEVTKLSRKEYYDHVGIIFGNKHNHEQLRILDVLARLRTTDLRALQ